MVSQVSGEITLEGASIFDQREKIAYVPQRESVDWDFPASVLDVVTMGLYRKIGWFMPVRKQHKQLALQALEQVGSHRDLANRQISQLSGGQQQRTFLPVPWCKTQIYILWMSLRAVDAATEQSIVSVLRSMQSNGKTMLVCIMICIQYQNTLIT